MFKGLRNGICSFDCFFKIKIQEGRLKTANKFNNSNNNSFINSLIVNNVHMCDSLGRGPQ